ncbi:hypothetical protein FRC20_001991, partial [Serendipita sp. 405]
KDSVAVQSPEKGAFWLPNAIFFAVIHLGAALGMIFLSPPSSLDYRTAILTVLCWQLPCFGITIGYHRLWSHKAFRAHKVVRFVLAIFGTMAFQGSIKWWYVNILLSTPRSLSQPVRILQGTAAQVTPYKFTDDPVHDPYAATRGLFFSHMGWIFRKPTYTKLSLIEKDDLDRDPIVRFQHKYYVPLALFTGLVMPTLIAATWGDAVGGDDNTSLPKWSLSTLTQQAQVRGCLLVIDGYVVDASSYIGEHPGGAVFLRRYAVPKENLQENEEWRSATWAFQGGMNVHSRIAKNRMTSLRVAKLVEPENGN